MRKLFFGGLTAVTLLALPSCLGSGSNQQTWSTLCGVVALSTSSVSSSTLNTVLECGAFEPYKFYSPQLSSLTYSPGDCVVFGCSVDMSAAENANAGTTGIVQGSLNSINQVTKYDCLAEKPDTTALVPGEAVVANPIDANYGWQISGNILFLFTDFSASTNQKTNWTLYFDPQAEPTIDNSTNQNVYTFYLRANVTSPDSSTSPTGQAILNAFNTTQLFSYIYNKEGASKNFSFKICYLKKINDDGSLDWEYSDTQTWHTPASL
jgi:hypothetical protein